MTDQRETAEPKKARGGIPPLVWILVALLVGWFVVMMVQRSGRPQGTDHPAQAEGASVMPAAPASGDAPATPAGVVNGPNQGPQQQP
jgi:hypothetical protein